jgi:glucose-6-phosphate 1-epimerase
LAAASKVSLLNSAGDTAEVSLFGAQVLSWIPAAGAEQLYCSPHATLPGRAIRGGVPICFPQFANCGPLAKHGFARTSVWQMQGEPITGVDTQIARATFLLQNSPLTWELWPFSFALQLDVILGAGYIECRLQVTNTGSNAFDFTAALHTYLAVADVRKAQILGLASVSYLDSLKQNEKSVSSLSTLQIADEIDRVYLSTPTSLAVLLSGSSHMRIDQSGFADTVVWNPGTAKAAALGDMPAQDWERMLCVEAAQIDHPVHLSPGNQWQGAQRLIIVGEVPEVTLQDTLRWMLEQPA